LGENRRKKLNQIVFDAVFCEVGIVAQFHFFHNTASVCAYGFNGYIKLVANFLERIPIGKFY
jgi:hypothetical protein